MCAAPRHAAWTVGLWLVVAATSPAAVSAQIVLTEAGGSVLAGQSSSDSASTTIDASGQMALPDAPGIATMRIAWNVNADAAPGLAAVEVGLLSYTVGFTLEHPASFNLRLDFQLVGGLLRIADQPGCVGAVSQADISIPTLERLGERAQAFPIDIVLPGEALDAASNTAGSSFTRQASVRLLFRDEPVDTTSYRLQFLVTTTAISQSCEVSARFGAQNGSTTGCDACVYPGALERNQEGDGLFITAIVENLCGNSTLDPGETCDLGEANGAEGGCCDAFCRAAAAGSACGDDGSLCTADLCTADGTCSHPPVAGATCEGGLCTCDDDGLFCNGKVQCGASLCIVLPPPCFEDDTCDEERDICVSPFGTPTPTVTPSPTATGATPGAATPTAPGATPTATATAVAAPCAGDCNGDRMVVVNELVLGVNVALGNQPASVCPAFDGNGDGTVAINELVAGVSSALAGCRP